MSLVILLTGLIVFLVNRKNDHETGDGILALCITLASLVFVIDAVVLVLMGVFYLPY